MTRPDADESYRKLPALRSLSPGWMLFILTGLNLFNYVDRYVLSAVLEQIKTEFTLDDAQAGWLGTAFMLGYFLTSPIFGYLGDRFPRKWLIAAGVFVWSLATLLTGFATSFWEIVAYRVAIGVGEASYATLSPGLLSDVFPPDRRNNAFTIFYVAIPFGAALGVMIGSWIGANYGWHYAFIWTGAPGLLLALVLVPFREPARGEAEGKQESAEFQTKPSTKDVLGLFAIRDYNLICWGYAAFTFAMGAYAHWAPTFLTRVHHVPQEEAGRFFGMVMVVAGLFGTFLGGFASTWWRKRNPAAYALTIGLSTLAAVPLTYLVVTADAIAVVKWSMAAAIFMLFLSTGPVNTLTIESVPGNLRASAMAGQIFLIHAFGDVWSPTVVGKVSAAAGDDLSRGLAVTPWALAVAAGLWLWLAALTRRERGRS
jgi:MFS family permease